MVIGKGELSEKVKQYVTDLGLQDIVLFVGNVPYRKMPLFYNAVDVLLLPSNFEGSPFVVIEALACGLPVVATDAGEIRRFVRNGFSGEVVSSTDPSRIAEAVPQVLHYREKYISFNCMSCVSGYTPDNVFQPVYEMCRTLSMLTTTIKDTKKA